MQVKPLLYVRLPTSSASVCLAYSLTPHLYDSSSGCPIKVDGSLSHACCLALPDACDGSVLLRHPCLLTGHTHLENHKCRKIRLCISLMFSDVRSWASERSRGNLVALGRGLLRLVRCEPIIGTDFHERPYVTVALQILHASLQDHCHSSFTTVPPGPDI